VEFLYFDASAIVKRYVEEKGSFWVRSRIDEFVKSRHSGENRSPDGPQLLENTGFRLLPE
jgi:hypothetical protein